MSALEDSEVEENLAASSNVRSYRHLQVHSLPPDGEKPWQSDLESEFTQNIEQDHRSESSFLPSSDKSYDPNAEGSPNHASFDDSEDPSAAAESYYSRPNRYYGPASTWRSWTKEDRDVAESLELERAQNLSIHLYNAHVLRREAQRLQDSSGRKRRRGMAEVDDEGDEIFGVPKVWTAWPMPPNEVPRDSIATIAADPRPSKELEDCLISTTARAARRRWDARAWHEEHNVKQTISSGEGEQEAAAARERSEHDGTQALQKSETQASAEDEASPGTSNDASADDVYRISPIAKPVPLADDDKARGLLLPSTRHIISKLDHLLVALHHARRSYALPTITDEEDKAASSATDAEGETSASSGKRRRRSPVRRASSVSTVDTEASASTRSSKRRKGVWKEGSVPPGRKFKGLGLRDWSDVLGMAALTGWDDGVVARASKRCAELFGEDMLFRRFHEAKQTEEESFFAEQLASGEEPLQNRTATYSQSPPKPEKDEGEDSHMEGTAGTMYLCPIKTCPRHTTPFHTAGNLKRHMTYHHASSEPEQGKDGITEAATYSQKRIFCPVHTCHKSREPFSTGPKLYHHVRKLHPEVNVDDLKKLESRRRGETRGKWTGDRRKRNPHERG